MPHGHELTDALRRLKCSIKTAEADRDILRHRFGMTDANIRASLAAIPGEKKTLRTAFAAAARELNRRQANENSP